MQISARSYLTAGVSLTAAAAIALTPVAVHTPDRIVTIPKVTVTDINLTVTPAEIVEFINTVRLQINAFNASAAKAAAIPGQTVVDGITTAMTLNDQFFDSLVDAVGNPTLQALLETVEITNDRALRSLAAYIDQGNQTIVLAAEDIADLLTDTMAYALSNVLAAAVDALNNPLAVEKYAHVLAAVVGDGFLFTNGGSLIAQKAGNAAFDLTYGTLEFIRSEATTALDAARRLAYVASGATGSEVVQAAVSALGTIGLAPAYLGLRLPIGLAEQAVLSSQSAFNTLFRGIAGYRDSDGEYVFGAVTALGEAVRSSIDEIGHGPLDPKRYLAATALMIAGSFDAANIGINTAGVLAQVPFTFGIDLINPDGVRNNLTSILTVEAFQIGNSLSNLLSAAGLPDEIAEIPRSFAIEVNKAIVGTAVTVADGLANVNAAISGGTDLIITVSNDIENAILGGLSGGQTDPPASGGDDDEPADNEPIIVPPIDDDTDDQDTDDEDTDDEDGTDPDDLIVDDGGDTDWDDDEFDDAGASTETADEVADDEAADEEVAGDEPTSEAPESAESSEDGASEDTKTSASADSSDNSDSAAA